MNDNINVGRTLEGVIDRILVLESQFGISVRAQRATDGFLAGVDSIAQEEHCSRNELRSEALRFYIGLHHDQRQPGANPFACPEVMAQDRLSHTIPRTGQDSTADIPGRVRRADEQSRRAGHASGHQVISAAGPAHVGSSIARASAWQ